MTTTPISTSHGILKGRDAIYLDRLLQTKKELVLEGEINGSLSQLKTKKGLWIGFRLTFRGTESYEVQNIDICQWATASSFDHIEGSAWLKGILAGTPNVSEYIVSTYDFIVRIAAVEYALEFGVERRG